MKKKLYFESRTARRIAKNNIVKFVCKKRNGKKKGTEKEKETEGKEKEKKRQINKILFRFFAQTRKSQLRHSFVDTPRYLLLPFARLSKKSRERDSLSGCVLKKHEDVLFRLFYFDQIKNKSQSKRVQ